MDFNFSEEQRLLGESVERFVQNDYTFAARQKTVADELGFDRRHWKTFADLGWLGVPFAESDGGFGGGPIEVMLLMERFGRGLVTEPYLSTVLLAGRAIALAGSAAQKERWLTRIVAGSLFGAYAVAEPQSRFNVCDIACVAAADGASYVLNGAKAVVLHAATADVFVVAARTAGTRRDRAGLRHHAPRLSDRG